MCRSTDGVSPSLVRKRSDRSRSNSGSCSSDDDTATTASIRKRVSFDADVRIYPLERLANEDLCDVFYRPADYRRFRSDSCLELLDQQQLHLQLSPLAVLFQRLVSAIRAQRGPRCRPSKKAQASQSVLDYPWMEAYYPQEQSDTERSPPQAARTEPRKIRSLEASRERRTIQELAFIL
jgi:hypothetical protein